ncbi:MAG TPA: hypothetical protein IAA00_14050 [Candidatus Blautia ornithocaccae]|nr:hypothetical protein [Candidatus Blautia ornithocaccae]
MDSPEYILTVKNALSAKSNTAVPFSPFLTFHSFATEASLVQIPRQPVIGEFEEGARTCVEIPDTKGNTIMKVQARREGEEILLSVEGGKGNFQIKNLGSQTVKVES